MDNIQIFRETNGLQYMISNIKNIKSSTISVMIKTGSIYEDNSNRGGAHLLEHILFRGNTQLKEQLDISRQLDAMGARYNAYTDCNIVSFHIKVQNKFIEKCVNILGNMIANSYLRSSDIDEEKLVVIQELQMDKDNPVSYVRELNTKLIYEGNNYSYPVGGDIQSVKNISNTNLMNFWKSNYNTKNIVLSVSGSIPNNKIKAFIQKSPFMTNIQSLKENIYKKKPSKQNSIRYNYDIRKEMKQVQLCIGFPTFSNKNIDKFTLEIIKIILAGPMSSRLFVIMRNKYGIAYNISANTSLNNISGDITISSGVEVSGLFTNKLINKGNMKADPIKVILEEVFKFCKEYITLSELNLAKEFIKGSVILDSEDSESISQFYGKQRILEDNVITLETYIEMIDKVTIDDIKRVSKDIFKPKKMNISLVGNFDPKLFIKYIETLEDIYIKYLQMR
jgi:predicted Zn-dependent peptidase